ncbi:hypothetical protein [Bryobacter aggregatus]|uniref:hypothetical protein n=1 Tax=Bryobacter aggregatus TaxID=360054 RepID=UPI0004E1D8F3|nr:hypothetical protein [Bryobacter aggregatus]
MLLLLSLLALNVVASLVAGEHPIVLGSFSFPARTPFKPLLLFHAFLAVLLLSSIRRDREPLAANSTSSKNLLRIGVSIGALTALAYLPSFWVNFHELDWTHRHNGAGINSWNAFWNLFSKAQPDGMYRPLAFLSFWLDYQVFGDTLWGYHLQSVAIHSANAVLLLLLAQKLKLSTWTASFAAILFGWAAIHFEAVLWPAARFDLLATTFLLLSILLWLQHRQSEKAYSWAGAGSLGLYVLATLCKETAYSLVVLIPILYWVLNRSDRPREQADPRPYLLALALCTVAMLGVRYSIYHGIGGYAYGTAAASASFSFRSLYHLLLYPLTYGGFGINNVFLHWSGAAVLFLYVAGVLLWYWRADSRPARNLGFFLGMAVVAAIPVFPVIGWLQPTLQHSRHLYWPSAWIALGLAVALERSRLRLPIAALFLGAQLLGVFYNQSVYLRALAEIEGQTTRIGAQFPHPPQRLNLVREAGEENGIFYYESELAHRLSQELPHTELRICSAEQHCEGQTLAWKVDRSGLQLTRRSGD